MVSLSAQVGQPDLESLLQELVSAQLIAEQDSPRLLTRFRSAHDEPTTSLLLATFLVQNRYLTPYQADMALNGFAGRLQIGPYTLVEPLADSGFSGAYKSIRRSDKASVTLLKLPMRNLWSAHEAKRHLYQIQELPPHPTLVPLIDLDTSNGCHFFVWPEVAGDSFAQLVERAGNLPPTHASRFMLEIAEGLSLCHHAGVFHGTLGPHSLLLGPDRRPRILDIGLGAILFENLAEHDSMFDTLSRSQMLISTLDCLAPELIEGGLQPNATSDIYSFGCVLYFLLTGSLPFPASNCRDQLYTHLSCKPISARELTPAVSASLSQLLEELLDRDPTKRPADILQIRDRLLRLTDGRDSVAIIATNQPMKSSPPLDLAEVETPNQHHVKTRPNSASTDAHADCVSSINFNLPPVNEEQSFELAVSGAFPLPKLDEVETIEQALERANSLAMQLRAFETQKRQGASQQANPVDESTTIALDSIPDPVTWVANQKSKLQDSNHHSLFVPRIKESFWTRAIKSLKFWETTDLVQVSLFGPRTIIPGQPTKLRIYLHLPDDFHNVKTLSRAMEDQVELLGVGNPDRLIPRGHELGLHLSVANGGVAKSVFRHSWDGKPKSFLFELLVPWESPAGRSPAVLSLGLNNVLCGRIAFAITIRARAGA